MSISQKVFEVTLAGLLHDIGKPYQRAVKSDRNTLCKVAKGLEVGRGESSYAHAKWTSDFINRNDTIMGEMLGKKSIGRFDALASCHHNPSGGDVYQRIIAEADRASAGMDRQNHNQRIDDSEKSTSYGSYFTRPMDSVFSRIKMSDIESSRRACYHLYTQELFPSMEQVCLSSKEYHTVCESFSEAFSQIDRKTPERFLTALADQISRHFKAVPSSTMEEYADIPLPDHSITTAAIAAAMARAEEELNESFELRNASFLWVSGDFGGIQNFIFSLHGESTKHIAKLLRGRSFMVNMMTIVAARMITDACGVPPLNALFMAGGKFQILLPDTLGIRKDIEKVRQDMITWVFNEYFGELKLIIDHGVSFGLEDFNLSENRFTENVVKPALVSLNKEKKKIFAEQLKTPDSWVDDQGFAEMHGGSLCKICGRENAEKDDIGRHCNRFIALGKNLTKGHFVRIVEAAGSAHLFGKYDVKILGSDFSEADTRKNEVACAVYAINSHDGVSEKFPNIAYAAYTPKEKMVVEFEERRRDATFEAIAEESAGLSALAVLKADVDNLGFILSKGLWDANSVSRRRALSRLMDGFFTGYLPGLLKKEFPMVYTLFAGGDDLCLIGPWNHMIDLSARIQSEFDRYVGSNPSITISAGVELFHTGAPVSRAVERAEELLETSKDKGRNRITIFDRTMEWGEDFDVQRRFFTHWQRYIQETNADNNRNSMLYRFLRYWQQWKNSSEKSIEKYRHRFQFIYDISRNIPEGNGARGVNWKNEEPFRSLITTKTENMEESPLFKNLGVGLSITMYKNRTKSNKE